MKTLRTRKLAPLKTFQLKKQMSGPKHRCISEFLSHLKGLKTKSASRKELVVARWFGFMFQKKKAGNTKQKIRRYNQGLGFLREEENKVVICE